MGLNWPMLYYWETMTPMVITKDSLLLMEIETPKGSNSDFQKHSEKERGWRFPTVKATDFP